MEIFYQGKNITDLVQVRECVVRDTCGERCDSLNILFENAAGWFRWQPEVDDEIIVAQSGYNSGIMYLHTVEPENGKYRIIASSLPCRARNRISRSYAGKTLFQIMLSCAASSGMEAKTFGTDGGRIIPYIQQEDESCAAFLNRLLSLEGSTLKCVNGKYAAIDIGYAQELNPAASFVIKPDQQDVVYRRAGTACKSVTVKSPYGQATAADKAVSDGIRIIKCGELPVMDDTQAGRWATGELLSINRKCESLMMRTEFNPALTAMSRVVIAGQTDASGDWIVDRVEHDLVNKNTMTSMLRCIRSIGA